MTRLPLSAQRKQEHGVVYTLWDLFPLPCFHIFPLGGVIVCRGSPCQSSPPCGHNARKLPAGAFLGNGRTRSLGSHFHIQTAKICRHILTATKQHTILWDETLLPEDEGVCQHGLDLTEMFRASLVERRSYNSLRKSLLLTNTQFTRPWRWNHVAAGCPPKTQPWWRLCFFYFFSMGFPGFWTYQLGFSWLLLYVCACVSCRVSRSSALILAQMCDCECGKSGSAPVSSLKKTGKEFHVTMGFPCPALGKLRTLEFPLRQQTALRFFQQSPRHKVIRELFHQSPPYIWVSKKNTVCTKPNIEHVLGINLQLHDVLYG